MRRKRLKHIPNGIIGILDGYQIVSEFEYFDSKGPGTYEIDLLNGFTKFMGVDVQSTAIFEFIHEWFWREIKDFSIDITKIPTAKIIIDILPTSWISRHYTIRNILGFNFAMKRLITHNVGYTGKIKVILITDECDYSKNGTCNINK